MPVDAEPITRVATLALLASGMAIGLRHRARATKQGGKVPRSVDPTWFLALMPLIAIPMLLSILLHALRPSALSFSSLDVPGWLRLSGIPIGIVALLLFEWLFRHLGHNVTATSMPRSEATLVTTGPYRWVRHPMYTVVLLFTIACSLLTASWFIAACGIAAFILLALRSVTEERRLVEKFGDAYRDLQRRTGRFLPRLTGP